MTFLKNYILKSSYNLTVKLVFTYPDKLDSKPVKQTPNLTLS